MKRLKRTAAVMLALVILLCGCGAGPPESPRAGYAKAEETIIITPEEGRGFCSRCLLFIPEGEIERTAVLSVLNTGFPTGYRYDLEKLAYESGDLEFIKKLFPGRVIIMPLYERFEDMYTHALAAEALESTGEFARLDLQTYEMIKAAKELLSGKGISIDDKVIAFGFSAAGQFAHRFALLRPGSVKMVIAGGLGSQFTIPDKVVNGYNAFYPVGIYDLEDYGITYDDSYIDILQFIFQGDKDTNNVVLSFDGYSGEAVGAYYGIFGEGSFPGPEELFEKSAGLTASYCPNIAFRLYKGLGHDINEEVKTDIKEYVRANLKEE